MALERVPEYLVEILRKTDPELLARFLATGDELNDDDLHELEALLGQWLSDSDFWNALARQQTYVANAPPVQDVDPILDDELRILTEALGGDQRLAETVLVDFPSQVTTERRDPLRTQQAIVLIRQEVRVIIQAPPTPPPTRRLRIVRGLRRVFKGAAGGVLIAADIIVPDPTIFLIRVASIAGAQT